MEKKLGVVTLEQLGQPLTYPNRPRRPPEPIPREENPLQVPPNNRTAIHVRTSQPTRTRSKNSKMIYGAAANIARSRHSRSSSSTPIPKEAGRNSAR